jgi:adenylylsulfate kinase-like enzyme
MVREMMPGKQFMEVFLVAGISVCRERDTLGLNTKAKRGEIKQYTGIDSPTMHRRDRKCTSVPEGLGS